MRFLTTTFLMMAFVATSIPASAQKAQPIPKELWGKWIVRRDLPTHMISCWGDEDARRLIGTEIEYAADLFRWKGVVTKSPAVVAATVTARQFHDEYSGQGAGSSDVTFKEVGINAGQAKRITIRHPDTRVIDATVEIPGDDVFIRDQNTIIFSVCNVFFEATRETNPNGNRTQYQPDSR